jgi:hypothetical protein
MSKSTRSWFFWFFVVILLMLVSGADCLGSPILLTSSFRMGYSHGNFLVAPSASPNYIINSKGLLIDAATSSAIVVASGFQVQPTFIGQMGVLQDATGAMVIICTSGCATPVTSPALNGVIYTNTSGALLSTAQGGAGTLCLVETNGGAPVWGSCSGSAATAWSSLTNPSANVALSMGNNTTTWTAGTATTNPFIVNDTTANTGTNPLFQVNTVGTSAAAVAAFYAKGTTNGVTISNAGVLAASGSGTINATTAAALAAVPTQCGANNFATGVAANGNANCSVAGTVSVVGAGSLTSTAFATGGGGNTVQTSSPTSTLTSSGNATFVGTTSSAVFDHDVHVDGTTYTTIAGAVSGNSGANPNACSTLGGCAIYEEVSTDVWSTNPFYGSKNYSVYLGFGTQTGTDTGIYYTKMPIVLSSDQIYGQGISRYNGSGPNEDGSYGTVIRACVGNSLCGGSYFPTSPPSPPIPAASFSNNSSGGGTAYTETINIELVWIVNVNTSPDAGTTGSTYGVPGASMPGPAITQVLTLSTSGITIAPPCANPTCVFNGTGGNPADFPAFSLGQAYAMNQYVTGSGTSGLNNPGTGHIYRVMQPIASSAAVTFHGTANEQVHDTSGACTSPTVSAANNCFYVESGPDANWLPVVGYLVYVSMSTQSNGQFIRQPTGPNYCASTVNVGGTTACAVNTQYLLNTTGSNGISTSGINQPPIVDMTHPLTVLGEQVSNGSQTVVFRSRFENLVLDPADQAGECGEDYISQEGSGYFNDICKGAVTDAFYVYTGPGSQNSVLSGGYATNNAGGTHVNSLRYGVVCDSRGGGCMRKLSDLTIIGYQMAGASPPSCLYLYGGSTAGTEVDSIHVESCVDGVTVSGFNNGLQAGINAGPVVTIQGVSGLGTITNVIHVGVGARSVAATEIAAGGASASVLDDNSYDILGTINQNGTYFGGSALATPSNQSGMLNFFLNGINDAPMAYRYSKGTTTTAGLLACMQSSRTVTACAGSATNFLGVFVPQNGSTNTLVQTAGEALVTTTNSVAVGDNICEGTDTTGKATGTGTTACGAGLRVGVVTSITVGPAFGVAGTVSATKPLVQLGRN